MVIFQSPSALKCRAFLSSNFIQVGQPILVLLQRKRTPLMTHCMKAASFLGTEDFLGLWLTFLQLCVNSQLARMYSILMAISMFSVGYFKVHSLFDYFVYSSLISGNSSSTQAAFTPRQATRTRPGLGLTLQPRHDCIMLADVCVDL